MDHRIALESNSSLLLYNDRGETFHCIIQHEIGRGGSCIVYEATHETDTGDKILYRIKEFYPYNLNINRNENNILNPSSQDTKRFQQRQQQFRYDFSRTNQLFYSDDNYASMTNQLDIFYQNGTSYILSAYSSKKTLATYHPKSLKECIMLVKQVAYVMNKIHNQGYLYLDIKPENILVVDGYPKQIQLFDFDSLLSIEELQKKNKLNYCNLRLSYSKGYAAIELQTSQLKRLGIHTDVYSIGALMFNLLFGYTPTVSDCEMDAIFDFSKIKYDYKKCDDRLFHSLRVFFHHTLAIYHADRYQSMQEVIEKLQEIEKYADIMIPRIYSTHIAKPKIVYGREDEFKQLDYLLSNPNYNCLFVTGMGGIGKSTFIREFLIRRQENFDTILYTYYKENTEATISNDISIEINTLRQNEEIKTGTRYFDIKLQKIRELVRGTSAILVIDNFNGEVDDDLRALLSTDLKIILLSRVASNYTSSLEMNLSTISNKEDLRHIFEYYLGRLITEDEYDSFNQILKHIGYHTLVLELIAKQIANSHITIKNAASLTNLLGFSSIASEEVNYEKDNSLTSGTMGQIIDALFKTNLLSENKKTLMKVISLIGDDGININQFQQIMKLVSKNELNELISDGWLIISGDTISMHRVIKEAIHRWEWIPKYIIAAKQFLTYFYIEIYLESTKNNFPKKLRKYMLSLNGEVDPKLKDKWTFQKFERWYQKILDKTGLSGKVYQERYARIKDETAADIKKLITLLFQTEDILRECKREPIIQSTDLYVNLLYITVLNCLEYREDDYLLTEANNIVSKSENDFVLNSASELLDSQNNRNPITIMMLYSKIFAIYVAHGNMKKAKQQLEEAKHFAEKLSQSKVYALYYNLVSNYYDTLLNGAYDVETMEEKYLLDKLLDNIEKTLKYSKKELSHDSNHLYAKNLLAKATILMRSGRGSNKEIKKLMMLAKKIIDDNASIFADVQLQYHLVYAWFFVYISRDPSAADCNIQIVKVLSKAISATDRQKIYNVNIPCSNIYYELQCYDEAILLLKEGIELCSNHLNTDSYAQIRQELCNHLLEVGIKANQFELCQELIQFIDTENKEILQPQNKVIISNKIRKIISNTII